MHPNFKAAFLSTFILPGLGQLHKEDRAKGMILILMVNLFLLAALVLVIRGMGQLVVTARIAGGVDASKIFASLKQNTPAARWLLALFFALWAYGAIDALFSPLKERRGGDADDEI